MQKSTAAVSCFALLLLVFSAQRCKGQACEDTRQGCDYFKRFDVCEQFKPKIERICQKTCGWCSEIVTTTLAPKPSCVDTYPGCANLVRYCSETYRKYLENLCAKTCSWCPAEVTTPEPQWDVYTECSKTCGDGTRYRVPRCPDNNIDTCPKVYEDCSNGQCPTARCERGQEHRYKDNTTCCVTPRHKRCGVQIKISYPGRVIGGTPTNVFQWPWMVRLELTLRNGQTGLCGGSLVDSEWIVTAAHCVKDLETYRIAAYAGYGTIGQTRLSVERTVIHPSYNFPVADIALIKLSSRVTYSTFLQPICLARAEQPNIEQTCIATGWGVTESGRLSRVLLEVGLRKLPLGVCKQAYKTEPFAKKINLNMLCAGRIEGGVDTCLGDSGGPLMCQRCSSCEWYLAGITSFGPQQCGKVGQPGMYVNVASFEGWILRYTSQTQRSHFSCR